MEFAAKLHKNQFRRHPEGTPYFSHLAFVAFLVQKAGYEDDVVIAGLLHDALEDTDYTAEKMAEAFGAKVTSLVQSVSEQKDVKPWAERKRLYREMLAGSIEEAVAIACADHIHNVRSFAIAIASGMDIDKEFHAGISDRFAHEKALVEIFNQKLTGSELAQEFENSVNDLELTIKKYAR